MRWSLERFSGDERCERVLVVHAGDQREQVTAITGSLPKVEMIEGGETRRESVRNALEHLFKAGGPRLVLIHDAARPFLPTTVIDHILDRLSACAGVVPVLAVTDTMVVAEQDLVGDVVPRQSLRRVQTPQGFQFDAILDAHRQWTGGDATDDAQMLRAAGSEIHMVDGSPELEKITFPEDFALAENGSKPALRIAMGMGYDVHRLVAGKELWLGGVSIPHSHGLSGHSDADAALHALTDAILGALAEGDIGQHFPPSDPQWKGTASWQFLDFARERATIRGGDIQSVDLTIICEAPKIAPYREAIRNRIADILQLSVDRISVKATTTEGLGFAGRREGIAAQAIVSLSLP